MSLITSLHLKTFVMRSVGLLKNRFKKMFFNKGCHLGDLQNLTSQYFSNDRSMNLQDHKWVKHPFKVQDRSVDFNVTKTEIFANPTL